MCPLQPSKLEFWQSRQADSAESGCLGYFQVSKKTQAEIKSTNHPSGTLRPHKGNRYITKYREVQGIWSLLRDELR